MGGLGSGHWFRWDKKTTTDEVHRIDIRYMRKRGMLARVGNTGTLSWSCRGEQTGWIRYRVEQDALILLYRYRSDGEQWQNMEERVCIERTPCNYGGERQWFLCPHCGRRVAVLYGVGVRFLCRHCYGLSYASQSETYMDRQMRKAQKIRLKLSYSDNLDEPIRYKPKGMHRKTFEKLVREENQANRQFTMLMHEKIELFELLGWL